MNEDALFLSPVQCRSLRMRVLRFLRRYPERRRRRGRLTITAILRMTLLAFRHNLTQRLLAGLSGASQSAVCRAIAWMRGLLLDVLAPEITMATDLRAAIEELLADGRPHVVCVDGTHIPIAQRSWDTANYSGKHRRVGRNLQVVAEPTGRLLGVGVPCPGRVHDRTAVTLSGVEAVLAGDPRLLVHADRGYRGTSFITPHMAPPRGTLTPEQRLENREHSGIRNAVERTIAHLKRLAILRTGIRTRHAERDMVVVEIVAVALGLAVLRSQGEVS